MTFPNSAIVYNHAANQQRKAADIIQTVENVLLQAKKNVEAGNQNPRHVNRQVGFDVTAPATENGIQLKVDVTSNQAGRTDASHLVEISGDNMTITTSGLIKGEKTTISREIALSALSAEKAAERVLGDLGRNDADLTGVLIKQAQDELKHAQNPALANVLKYGAMRT